MSWQTVQLKDIASVLRGVTFTKNEGSTTRSNGRLPIIRAGSIQKTLLTNEGIIWVPSDKVKKDQIVKKNDIVMCTSSGSPKLVGKCAKATQDWIGSYGAFCVAIRVNDELCDPSFLLHYLHSPLFRSWTSLASGANIKNIRISELSNFLLKLPPISEQKRIAAILDKADAIRRKRQQAIELADEFLRSVFLDMFGDLVVNPKRWEVKPISALATIITGNTPPRADPENYGDHIEWIKSDNINTPSHYLTLSKERLSKQGLKKARVVNEGSILMTCIAGSRDCIGNSALVDRKVAFNQQINALTPNDQSTTEYLYAIALFSKRLIQGASTNSMKGMVSKGNLEKLLIPAPPIEAQRSFTAIFHKYLVHRSRVEKSLSNSDNLFSSLSQKAFSGNL